MAKKKDKDIKVSKDNSKKAAKAKKSTPKKGKDGKAAKPGLWTRITTYFKNVRAEMHRVIWPTPKELLNASAIVIGALIFFGVLIAIVDNVIVIPLDFISQAGVESLAN